MDSGSNRRPGSSLARVVELRDRLQDEDPSSAGTRHEQRFRDWVNAMMDLDPETPSERDAGKNAVETMGLESQRQAAKMSDMLKQPLSQLSKRVDEGGEVGNALLDLSVQIDRVDPAKFNLEPGWFLRLVQHVPGVGSPIKRYITRYQSVGTVIQRILKSLERGRDELQRDIVTLGEDQKRMRMMTVKLQRTAALAQRLDSEMQARLDSGSAMDEEQKRFVAEELLFPLRQRILDLQQQLAVNQQGVLAAEIIIRNNKELIRGVNRALNVTSSALQVGATVALALAAQKRVLEKIEMTSKATSDLIAGTAKRLRTQGVEIQKQASSAQLNLDSLRTAFADLNLAMEDLSKFRQQALPQMAQSVLEFDKLTREGQETIARMEKARRSGDKLLRKVG